MTVIDDSYILSNFRGRRQWIAQKLKKFFHPELIVTSFDREIYNYLMNRFSDSESLKETLYRIQHQLEVRPVCVVCKGHLTSDQIVASNTHCCCRCSQLDKDVRLKNENTNMKLYGVKNGMQAQQSKDKYERTMLRTIGRRNIFCGSEGAKVAADGMFRTYGETNSQKVPHIHKKTMDTFQVKFHGPTPFFDRTVFLKSKSKYFYDNKYFHSKAELSYYIWLSDQHVSFEYNPNISFVYKDADGKNHKYFPDFLVEGKIIEIKGGHFFRNGKMINPYDESQNDTYESKHQCMLSNNVSIILDTDKVISDAMKYVTRIKGQKFFDSVKVNKH